MDADEFLEMVEFLVTKDPGALLRRTNDGLLPLHIACANSTALPYVVLFLVEQQSVATEGNANLLHIALEHGAPLNAIELLFGCHDLDVTVRNNAGETPLHVACRRGAAFEVVQFLVGHDKAAVRSVTCQGDLPLFLACATTKPSLDTILLLLERHLDVVFR
jgi:ankyrin repeat protein